VAYLSTRLVQWLSPLGAKGAKGGGGVQIINYWLPSVYVYLLHVCMPVVYVCIMAEQGTIVNLMTHAHINHNQ